MDNRRSNKFNLMLSSLSIRDVDERLNQQNRNRSPSRNQNLNQNDTHSRNVHTNLKTPEYEYPSYDITRGSNEGNHNGLRDLSDRDDDEIINILPSYQMYQSTISKNLTPTREDCRTQPPRYELTPQSSQVSSSASSVHDYFSEDPLPASSDLPSSRRPFESAPHDDTVDDFTRWEDTILANSHKLKRLPSINKEVSKHLNVQIQLTDQIGKIGVPPNIVDPLSFELKQGDCIYGFVTVTNQTETDIPFDMFAVVLEGATTFGDNQKPTMQPPTQMNKFLNMFDFNASWNDGCLDRLSTDHNNPHFVFGNHIDPVDNTYTQLDYRKVFEPHKTYKKFFTFKLPEKLLDSSCAHGFVKHLQLPQTLGVSKNEIISSLRQKWRDGYHKSSSNSSTEVNHLSPVTSGSSLSDSFAHSSTFHHQNNQGTNKSDDVFTKNDPFNRQKNKYSSPTNDFAFPDACISYSISARIIGKASEYENLFNRNPFPHLNPNADEYVVANEDNCYLRAIFTTHSIFELNRSMINEEARLICSNMINKIEDKIQLGRELSYIPNEERESHSSSGLSLHPTSSATELAKMQQSYYTKIKHYDHTHHRDHRDSVYEVFLPYKKKSILGPSKVIGLATLSTPKTEYMVSYFPLEQYSLHDKTPPDTSLTVPFDLMFIFTGNNNHAVPDLRKVSVELIALTVKSRGLPIPVVFHPDMLFENKSRGSDNFDVVTIKRFQKYASEITKLLKELGAEKLDIDRELICDIKSLANLSSKFDHLKIQNPTVSTPHSSETTSQLSSIPWETEAIQSTASNGMIEEHTKYTKKFDLHVDLKDAIISSTGSKDFCLVPDFQYCLLARLYYLKVDIKCPNGEKITMKVPIVLQRQRDTQEDPVTYPI